MRVRGSTWWRLAAAGVVGCASPVVAAPAASANCLATLHARTVVAHPGEEVVLFGTNYSESATAGPILIRLDERRGPVIAALSARRLIENVPVTIPVGTAAGVHTLLAVQHNSLGNQISCGPGRATVQVLPTLRPAEDAIVAGPAVASRAGGEVSSAFGLDAVATRSTWSSRLHEAATVGRSLPALAAAALVVLGLVVVQRRRLRPVV